MSIDHINPVNRHRFVARDIFQRDSTRKILNVALKVFGELSVTLVINLAAMTFFATPISVAALSTALVAALVSTVVRAVWDIYKERYDAGAYQHEKKVSRFTLMNLFSLAGPGILIHEAGHALASLSLFKKASPSVSISPLNGGSTSFVTSAGLTGLGKRLGYSRSMGIVCAGGMIASTVWCLIAIGASEGIKDRSPMLAEAIKIQGLMQIFNEIVEGIAVLIKYNRDIGSDFVRLWIHYGVHPAIPVALMIAIPLITLVAIHCFAKYRRKATG